VRAESRTVETRHTCLHLAFLGRFSGLRDVAYVMCKSIPRQGTGVAAALQPSVRIEYGSN
jgi:hypothetical protein